MRQKVILLLTMFFFSGACSSEPAPETENPATSPQPGASQKDPGPATPLDKPETTNPEQGKTPAPWEALSPDERILQAYQAIVCHMQKTDQKAVEAVWTQFGYDETSWASDVQKAIQQANNDPKGFGKKWQRAKRTRCP